MVQRTPSDPARTLALVLNALGVSEQKPLIKGRFPIGETPEKQAQKFKLEQIVETAKARRDFPSPSDQLSQLVFNQLTNLLREEPTTEQLGQARGKVAGDITSVPGPGGGRIAGIGGPGRVVPGALQLPTPPGVAQLISQRETPRLAAQQVEGEREKAERFFGTPIGRALTKQKAPEEDLEVEQAFTEGLNQILIISNDTTLGAAEKLQQINSAAAILQQAFGDESGKRAQIEAVTKRALGNADPSLLIR